MNNDTNFWIKGANTDCRWYWRALHKLKSRMHDWYVNVYYCLSGNGHYLIALGYMEQNRNTEAQVHPLAC